jgi:hypothetical protein
MDFSPEAVERVSRCPQGSPIEGEMHCANEYKFR